MTISNSVFVDQSALLAFLGHPDYTKFHDSINNWFLSYFKGINMIYLSQEIM